MLMHAAAGTRQGLYVDMERLLVAANNVRWRVVEGDSVALSLQISLSVVVVAVSEAETVLLLCRV